MLSERPTQSLPVYEYRAGTMSSRARDVVLEEPLALRLNGVQVAVLMRLPGMEKELAAGYCVSEGLVRGFGDLLTIHHCGRSPADVPDSVESGAHESRNRVEVRANPKGLRPDARLDVARLVRAGCGAASIVDAFVDLNPLTSRLRIPIGWLLDLPAQLQSEQSLHRTVGGVHAVGVFGDTCKETGCEGHGGPQSACVVAEDIGRHNAADKAIGYCLLRGIPLDGRVMLCSGRLSYEMATKAIRAGIPILASLSAPTSLAVAVANRFGLTLVGYLRGSQFTVYSHAERLEEDR